MTGACSPPKPEPVKTGTIADGDFDPANWGKLYPLEYDSWLKTKDPKPPKSKYKKGYDTDLVIYDKLSEFPYMALLFNGWGFGVEYNEPRGHYYMLIDQLEVDPSRLKAGGACVHRQRSGSDRHRTRVERGYRLRRMETDLHFGIAEDVEELELSFIQSCRNRIMIMHIHFSESEHRSQPKCLSLC